MILTLYCETTFDASHKLTGYNGKCSRLHGHTWKVSVWVKGDENQLDDVGILWDFGNLKDVVKELDHCYLNDILKENPTSENITLHIYKKLKSSYSKLDFKIRVYENAVGSIKYCESGDF